MNIFEIIGIVFSGFTTLVFLIMFLIYLGNKIFQKSKLLGKGTYIFIEYVYYRKQFKKWVKDKERHPKLNQNEPKGQKPPTEN